jgi:hypothetical protein
MFIRSSFLFLLLFLFLDSLLAQSSEANYTRADTLRGSIGPHRAWWNVLHYELSFEPDFTERSLKGRNRIEFKTTGKPITDRMQIDLQAPMQIDQVRLGTVSLPVEREGNVYWVDVKK